MAEAQKLPVGTVVGEYTVTGLLGAGGMGIVYSGVHPVIGKEVAIKVLSPNISHTEDIIARFVQEARAVNQIGHPNIIDIFAFGESPTLGHYFVMPRLVGEDLRQRIERTGPMPIGEAVAVLEQIADALDAAHESGIYHRDLKPDNVFLATRRRGGDNVKILDFGIAKLTEAGQMTVTRTGSPMGTPLFMSPEQWEGIGVDHRTDVYALAILFQYMVTGRFPFESTSQVALMRMHCDMAPTLPSQFGAAAAFDAPIGQALAKRADERFDTAGAFSGAVKAALSSGASIASPPSAPPSRAAVTPAVTTPPERSARSFIPWVAAAVIVTIVGVVWISTRGGGKGPTTAAALAPDGGAASSTAGFDAAPLRAATLDAAPRATKVTIRIKSDPKGATVFGADGKRMGVTPLNLKFDRADAPLELVVRQKDYDDARVSVDISKDGERVIDLVRTKRADPRDGGKDKPNAGSGSGSGSQGEGTKWGSPIDNVFKD